jgi:hypothetical protein
MRAELGRSRVRPQDKQNHATENSGHFQESQKKRLCGNIGHKCQSITVIRFILVSTRPPPNRKEGPELQHRIDVVVATAPHGMAWPTIAKQTGLVLKVLSTTGLELKRKLKELEGLAQMI